MKRESGRRKEARTGGHSLSGERSGVVSKFVTSPLGVHPGQCNSWCLVANNCSKPAFSLLDYLP